MAFIPQYFSPFYLPTGDTEHFYSDKDGISLVVARVAKCGVLLAFRLYPYVYRLTLRLLMSYIYGAPSKARNVNVVYIWTYVWQR